MGCSVVGGSSLSRARTPRRQESMARHWYVEQAFSQYEKKVRDALKEHIARQGREEYFGDILVPTEEVVEVKDGQRRTTERKLTPGSVPVHMAMQHATLVLRHVCPA